MCVLMFKSSHHPDGKIADVLASTAMGKLLTCLPRLTLAQLRPLRSTTEST
jgi:hypothetical protein